jgi:predicted nucleic acid-binding protein
MQKSACNENVRSFMETLTWEDMYLSVITMGEICYGIEKLPSGKKKHDLSIWLYSKLPEWFNRRIIEIDSEVMLEWGKIRARTKRTLPFADSIIAASAIVHHMFIVTRNVKDFDEIDGLNLINPREF